MTTDRLYSIAELLPTAISLLDKPLCDYWNKSYSINDVELFRQAIRAIRLVQEEKFSAIGSIETGYSFSFAVLND